MPSERPARRGDTVKAAALLATVVALTLAIHLGDPLRQGLWYRMFYDTLHVPVFAVMALCLYTLTGIGTGWGTARRMFATALSVVALSGLSEAAQIPGPRDASMADLLSDWLGAAGALLLVLSRPAPRRRVTTRTAAAVAGIALLGTALAPLALVTAAYVERNLQLPRLVSFDSHLNATFIRPQNAAIEHVRLRGTSTPAARIRFRDGPWPGVIVHDIWRDWSGYDELVIELLVPDGPPLPLNLRVHDEAHKRGGQPYSDRFNRSLTLAPGPHTIRIPLAEIAAAPAARRMDLTAIDGIVLFVAAGNAGREFYLIEIRLA